MEHTVIRVWEARHALFKRRIEEMPWSENITWHRSNLLEHRSDGTPHLQSAMFTDTTVKAVTQPGFHKGEERTAEEDFWNSLTGVRTFYVDKEVHMDASKRESGSREAYADEITYDGDRYRVLDVDRWYNHERVIARLITPHTH